MVELARLTETPTPHIDTVYSLVKLLARTMEDQRGQVRLHEWLETFAARRRSAGLHAPMKNATLRQLKVFEAVARLLSFSAPPKSFI